MGLLVLPMSITSYVAYIPNLHNNQDVIDLLLWAIFPKKETATLIDRSIKEYKGLRNL